MRKSSLQKSLLLHTQGVFKWLLLLLGELHGGREFNLNQYEVISIFKLILRLIFWQDVGIIFWELTYHV